MSIKKINKIAYKSSDEKDSEILMSVENWKIFNEKFNNVIPYSYNNYLCFTHGSRTVLVDENFQITKMGNLIVVKNGEVCRYVHNIAYNIDCGRYIDSELFKKILKSDSNFEIEEFKGEIYYRYIPYELHQNIIYVDLLHNNKLIARKSFCNVPEGKDFVIKLPFVGKQKRSYYGKFRYETNYVNGKKYIVVVYHVAT